jgi:O-succinylhomoserine sulfhydrylase
MDKKNFETKAIRTQSERSENREHSVPLYLTSSFVFNDAAHASALFQGEEEGLIYSRYNNPNTDELIHKLCVLEGTQAGFATATGMSAMFMSMAAFLRQGDHVVACRSIFGSTHQIFTQIFTKWGIDHTYVDINTPDNWDSAFKKGKTKMLFLETPSNPALDIIDLEFAGKLAKAYDCILNVDNCFATPYLQQPTKYGADIVTHSATKFIDGQGRVLGGAILGREDLMEEVIFMGRHTGPSMSPFNAWVLSKSLETLAIRMDRHCESALQLAKYLETRKEVSKVYYPFLKSHPKYDIARKQMKAGGGLVSFEFKNGADPAINFLNNVRLSSFTSNLGDSRTIVNHPASTTHSKLTQEERAKVGIGDGLVRVSVGLEHIEDIINDFDQAFEG